MLPPQKRCEMWVAACTVCWMICSKAVAGIEDLTQLSPGSALDMGYDIIRIIIVIFCICRGR